MVPCAATIILTIMTTEAALYRLLTWLSPAYPVGAYTYSHGLEWAVEAELVRDRDGLVAWLEAVLRHGGGWQDAVLLAHAHRAATVHDGSWREVRQLAHALAASSELALETRAQGEAFARASLASWPDEGGRLARLLHREAGSPAPTYPLAVAALPPATVSRWRLSCPPISRPSPPTLSRPPCAWSRSARPTASAPSPPLSLWCGRWRPRHP